MGRFAKPPRRAQRRTPRRSVFTAHRRTPRRDANKLRSQHIDCDSRVIVLVVFLSPDERVVPSTRWSAPAIVALRGAIQPLDVSQVPARRFRRDDCSGIEIG